MPEEKEPHRFLADAMLIRLARWLRVLDFDTRCHPEKSDAELVSIAEAEHRWLLTRDRVLVTELKPSRPLLIANTKPLEQLAEVVRRCDLPKPRALFKRCMMCNTLLRPATQAEVIEMAPWQSWQCAGINYCPGCRRLYWPGSHTKRMEMALNRALPDWFSEVTA